MQRVGVCVPGGAAAYPSTLLMTVCPAQAAGVPEIAVVMPPTKMGAYNLDLLATCHELGVSEVYRIGGAQAVAALAFGVEEIAAVDMIVGPGNIFVTLAKKYVFGQVAIDCLAGPSEVVVLADESADPDYVAADLIAQAEHDPGSSILITWHEPLIDAVAEALARQLPALSRGELARASLESFGAFVLTRDARQALEWTNQIGPEHLHIQTQKCREPGSQNRQCRRHLRGRAHARRPGRLCGWSFARAADRRHGSLRQRPLGQRFPAPLQRADLHSTRA